jgi:glyoxylase-like metal-dependent hydrolase (beta-lactamase superfamily II)
MKILRLVLPTPFPVGPINIYLLREDPLTLVDTGPRTGDSLQALREQLRAVGLVVSDIRRVLLTHTHEDHCGLAGIIQRESGAAVHVHQWEADHLSVERPPRVHEDLLRGAGVPAEELARMVERYQVVRSYADPVEQVVPYHDEEELLFATGSIRVVHTPGHTPGSSCFYREASRHLLAGDTILKSITPNPVLNPDPTNPRHRFPSLTRYLDSVARLRALSPTLLQTSHGGDILDYEEHYHRLLRHVEKRADRVVQLVPKEGITAWEMSQQLFPKVDGLHRFLATSETIAHLDHAVTQRRIERETPASRLDRYYPI